VVGSGCATVDGMAREPQVHDQGPDRHQKGTTRVGTRRHGVTRDGTETSVNGRRRDDPGARSRNDMEEVTGSIPVSPTTNGLVGGSFCSSPPGRSSLRMCGECLTA